MNEKNKTKRTIYLILFLTGFIIAVGVYIIDDSYGRIARLLTVVGLIISLISGILYISIQPALREKIQKKKKLISLLFILFIAFFICFYFYTDINIYHLPQDLIDLKKYSNENPEMKIYFDHFGKEIEFESDGLKLAGTIYGIKNETVRPAIVLIHGSSPYGRKLPLYRILSNKLVEEGYIVLTYDMRGYGESDDPKNINDTESWNDSIDATNAVSYLCSYENVDKSRIYIIGHSYGAVATLYAGMTDNRIRKIVAIGPPRRMRYRIFENNSVNLDKFWARFSRDRKLEKNIELDTYLEIFFIADDMFNDYFYEGHTPLLLIDGDFEGEEDKIFLNEVYNNMTQPKKYITTNNTGHYCNTSNIGNFMIYNKIIIEDVTDDINDWFYE